jgi:hypothetical protein
MTMSKKPHPVAETAAMLMDRLWFIATQEPLKASYITLIGVASLASDLHRLAPACQRQAEAECNGEQWNGQRAEAYRKDCGARLPGQHTAEVDAAIEAGGIRLDKRLSRLNESLAPFALKATRSGDPRGCCLRLESTDPSRPVPRNGFSDDWCIVGKGA